MKGKLLVAVKRLLARLPLSLGLIEFCKVCGQRQPIVWWASNALWEEVVGDRYNVLCPGCFEKAAESKGILLQWTPRLEWRREWGIPLQGGGTDDMGEGQRVANSRGTSELGEKQL